MARFLVLYGTTDGQTAKIAEFLAAELRGLGGAVDVVRAGTVDLEPRAYAGVIVAASIHAQGFQRPVARWARRHLAALQQAPTAFLAVCLGILQDDPEVRRDLDRIVARFVVRTGWTPGEVMFVPGALRYTRYGWLKRLVMRWIAARAGGSTDVTRDHEYTDWGSLHAFARGFHARVTLGGLVGAAAPVGARS